MKNMILANLVIAAASVAMATPKMKATEDIRVRDPFIVTDKANGRYYLVSAMYTVPGEKPGDSFGNKRNGGVCLYESKDLKLWTGPKTIYRCPPEMNCHAVWAPELHQWKGEWYLFATMNIGDGRGTWILRSKTIDGQYVPVKDGPVPPADFLTLDGTLLVDGGKPCMVYCHEWCQVGNGLMEYVPLADDLSRAIGKPVRMFDAQSAMKGAGKVTDGPFFRRDPESGALAMIWSNFIEGRGYSVLVRRSASGRLAGPWSKDEILYGENGGHGMIFETLDGKLMLTLHAPNNPVGAERMKFVHLSSSDLFGASAETDAEKHNSSMMNATPVAASRLEGDVRIVFVGNSITLHGKAPQIGWTNEWGMAASAAEKDYVHLVTKGIEERTGRKAAVMVRNLAAFERNFRAYDFAAIDDLVEFRPDYLVVALGENVPSLMTEDDRLAYRDAFKKLLSRFTYDRMQPNAVVRGAYWANPMKDELMAHAASDLSFKFVKTDFCNAETMAGTNRFAHAGVAAHPGDVGMRRTADVILEAFFPTKSGYAATMDGRPVAIRPIRISAMPFNQWAPDYQRPMDQTEIAGMVNVEADGVTEWRVKPERKFKKAVIRPLARGIAAEIENGEVVFTLPKPGYYVLELDDCHSPLEIFVNPKRDFAAEKKAANIVFGPGLHEPVVVKLKSHDRVYIDKDAVVKASFQAAGVEDVTVSGYGIIDGGRNRRVGNHCYRDGMDGAVLVYDSKNVKFDGPVVLDSSCWMVSAFNSSDLEFANLKVTGAWRYNTDGIDICNSQRVRVHDCYVHSFDDNLVVKGNFPRNDRKDPVEDIRFSNCVCWCGWGNTFEIGLETWAPRFRNVVYENCDAIRNSGSAIGVHLGGPAKLENIVYRNLNIEYPASNPVCELQKTRDQKYSDPKRTSSPLLYDVTNGKMFGYDVYDNIVDLLGYDPKDDPCGNVDKLVISNISVYVESGAPKPPHAITPQPGTSFGEIKIDAVRE